MTFPLRHAIAGGLFLDGGSKSCVSVHEIQTAFLGFTADFRSAKVEGGAQLGNGGTPKSAERMVWVSA